MRVGLAFVFLLSIHQSVSADVVWNFTYTDPGGSGFNEGAIGLQRQAALELAAKNFSTAFSSYNATIAIDVTGTATGSTLAAAGSNGGPTFMAGFGTNEVIRNKILSNNAIDTNMGAVDGTVTVNFATVAWQLDINATPVSPQFDWYSTMYHEFAHAVGFSSSIQTDSSGMNAQDAFGTVGSNNGEFGKFDQFLTDSAGNSVFISASDLNEASYEALLVGGTSPGAGLFFNGANATAANGGNPVGLYSPTTYAEGSSGSHLDDDNGALAGQMMLANTGAGPSARTFSAIELGIFKDIGYTNISQITPVPEPSAFLFMATVAGLTHSRRRRAATRGNSAA